MRTRRTRSHSAAITEIQPLIVRQLHPVAHIGRPHAQDVAQHVDLELVEVAVDARAQQRLQLVRAGFDLHLGQLRWLLLLSTISAVVVDTSS